jgi:rod shape-determining protein MreC
VLLLVVLSIVLITVDSRADAFTGPRAAARTVFVPMQDGATAMVSPVGRFFSAIGDLGDAHGRIAELEKENTDLRRRLRESELTGSRADELAKLKLLAGQGRFTLLPATVVGLGPSLGFEWTVTVDAGSRDGVRPDQTVVNGEGLVGRVKQVSAGSSVIVLAVDPGSSVGVRLGGSNQLAVASGNGLGPLTVTPLDPQTRIKVGDRLVSGPYGASTYVAGIPVGEVTAVSGDPSAPVRDATVRPYARFGSLDLVGIVLDRPRTDPRDRLLPATPPSATGSPTPPGGVGGPSPSPGGTP